MYVRHISSLLITKITISQMHPNGNCYTCIHVVLLFIVTILLYLYIIWFNFDEWHNVASLPITICFVDNKYCL